MPTRLSYHMLFQRQKQDKSSDIEQQSPFSDRKYEWGYKTEKQNPFDISVGVGAFFWLSFFLGLSQISSFFYQ